MEFGNRHTKTQIQDKRQQAVRENILSESKCQSALLLYCESSSEPAGARRAHNLSWTQVCKGLRSVTMIYSPHSPGVVQPCNMLALAKPAMLKPAQHKHLQCAVQLACAVEPDENSCMPGMAAWCRFRERSRGT